MRDFNHLTYMFDGVILLVLLSASNFKTKQPFLAIAAILNGCVRD